MLTAIADALKMPRIRGFIADRCGSVFTEFAVAMPVLIILILGGVEVGRYVLLHQKLNRLAATTSDLVSQAQSISQADLDQIFLAANEVMSPFELGAEGVVIVSSVSATGGNPPEIDWQSSGGGSGAGSSSIGSSGGAANLPAGFTVRDGENVIVAEVIFDFTPEFFPDVVSATQIAHHAINRPRFGSLSTLN